MIDFCDNKLLSRNIGTYVHIMQDTGVKKRKGNQKLSYF